MVYLNLFAIGEQVVSLHLRLAKQCCNWPQ